MERTSQFQLDGRNVWNEGEYEAAHQEPAYQALARQVVATPMLALAPTPVLTPPPMPARAYTYVYAYAYAHA